jgi:hypothetical protein
MGIHGHHTCGTGGWLRPVQGGAKNAAELGPYTEVMCVGLPCPLALVLGLWGAIHQSSGFAG